MPTNPDLDQAWTLIQSHCRPAGTTSLPLLEACGRICATSLRAAMAIPHFRQSTMDGFALRRAEAQPGSKLPISGEIAAGTTSLPPWQPGQAQRIMTGGLVPDWCDQVIPFELCREEEGEKIVQINRLPQRSHIRGKGDDVQEGQVIIAAGEEISPGHMHLAATAGATEVTVRQRPRVAILCTGSELVAKEPLAGQLVSGNLFLLSGLVKQAGGKVVAAATVADDEGALTQALAELPEVEMVISTGGMGPGKYDLVHQVLATSGVEICYGQLQLRPGKSTLFGVKDGTLFFGLPGPPPAVRLLFHELVRPALLAQQGSLTPRPRQLTARLSEELAIRQRGILNLKGGILSLENGQALVRPARRHEAASCIILVPAERLVLKEGELATIHLTDGLN
ncbi:MAG: molybdopterin molybdotransferase MoeA [Thermodesulfobacteriota bacterium]